MSNSAHTNPTKQINKEFIGAFVCGFIGWLCWQAHSPDFYVGGFMGLLMGMASVKCFFRGLWALGKAIIASMTWSRFQARGSAPKADGMASEDDLRRRGLLK